MPEANLGKVAIAKFRTAGQGTRPTAIPLGRYPRSGTKSSITNFHARSLPVGATTYRRVIGRDDPFASDEPIEPLFDASLYHLFLTKPYKCSDD